MSDETFRMAFERVATARAAGIPATLTHDQAFACARVIGSPYDSIPTVIVRYDQWLHHSAQKQLTLFGWPCRLRPLATRLAVA